MKTVISVISMLFLFTACGGETTKPETSSITSVEQDFLDTLYRAVPSTIGVDKNVILDAAHSLCDLLDEGGSLGDIIDLHDPSAMSLDDYALFAAGSVVSLCPEHEASLLR